ncbi:mediator complex subunit [Arachnomyces sp. PD_36]|nr:mediator complex subunit [Arachnomyces sp. PD_36]
MPGIVMDGPGARERGETATHATSNGIPSSHAGDQLNNTTHSGQGPPNSNGAGKNSHGLYAAHGEMFSTADEKSATTNALASALDQLPPELVHITQGFFPFGQLINRSTQQCWNDLSDLITELADVQVPPQNQSHMSPGNDMTNGKPAGNQSNENIHKKMRILEFAQAKRGEFIKLLVLSSWSRQAADVSKLIDLQNFIRTRHDAYSNALMRVGDMKRDLVRAQVANPDLETALEILSSGKVSALPDLGYIPPRPLTAKGILKTLRKINKIICVRLVLHDPIPPPFQTYLIHDGRVTFTVPNEFELDLSIAEENHTSQFYFIDIRFLFSPSSSIPKGRFFNDLDTRINFILMKEGLVGCFNFLHNLILTNKINILFKQALALSRGHWSDTLRVELLHRTLVVQYWANRPGGKSWVEIGVKSGRHGDGARGIPCLGLRWMRDNKEVDATDVYFNLASLSMERILRSVVALHASHVLRSVYTRLSGCALYSKATLSIAANLSPAEPGDCYLDVQLTTSRNLRVVLEPISGFVALQPSPMILSRGEIDRNQEKFSAEHLVGRISLLRCIAAMEEVKCRAHIQGWETVNPGRVKAEDLRRTFPPNVRGYALFWRKHWERNWVIAETNSMDGDNWWVIQLRKANPSQTTTQPRSSETSTLQSAQIVTGQLVTSTERLKHSSFVDLENALSGMIALHANARYLAELREIVHFPPARKLTLGPRLHVPNIRIQYQSSKLPPSLQILPLHSSKRKSLIGDTVHLSYQGIDSRTNLANLIVHGQVLSGFKNLRLLASETDSLVEFQPRGNRFAMRFFAPIGQSIIIPLFNRLQRLEHMLSALSTLYRKHLRPRSISLSRINFSYGSEYALRGSLRFNYNESQTSLDTDAATLLSRESSLDKLHMSIDFSNQNPHRRIKESLTAIINGLGPEAGLDSVTELLTVTLPLLRSLDQIASPTYPLPASAKAQITARNPKVYQIRYPASNCRFVVSLSRRRDKAIWILKEMNARPEQTNRTVLDGLLKEKIYNSKGDGWMGLDRGAVSDADKAGNLIIALDELMKSYADKSSGPFGVNAGSNNGNKCEIGGGGGVDGNNSNPPPPSGPIAGNINNGLRNGGVIKSDTQQKSGPATGVDVIMLD